MSHENASRHFVRISGKILGPFDFDQLQSLKSRGRLRAEHEVSLDRRSWNSASSLVELFGESKAGKTENITEELFEPDQPNRAVEWFYATGEQQQGPVNFQHLKRLVSAGNLTEFDLIWHSGLDEWIPAGEQPGLFSNSIQSFPSGRKNGPQAGRNAASTYADSQTLLWTYLLQQFRELISVGQLREFLRSLASIGGIAMLVAIAAIGAFYLTLAVKSNSLRVALMGAGVMLIASSVRFIGLHSLQAGEDLIRNSPQQFASLAFVKSIAVLLLTSGILLSSVFFVGAILVDDVSETIPLMMAASGILFVFVLGATFILQPEGMNISLSPDAQAGREGIAILSFAMKIGIRLSSFLYIAGAILACAAYGTAAYFVAFEGTRQVFSEQNLLDPDLRNLSGFGLSSLVVTGVVPLAAYLNFAVGSILLDICQSLMQLPGGSMLTTTSPRKSGIGNSDV